VREERRSEGNAVVEASVFFWWFDMSLQSGGG
jgi:hypothetical protein